MGWFSSLIRSSMRWAGESFRGPAVSRWAIGGTNQPSVVERSGSCHFATLKVETAGISGEEGEENENVLVNRVRVNFGQSEVDYAVICN